MDASIKKLLTDIQKKKFQSVYVLQGEEDYYIDLVASALENNVLQEHERSFNQIILYGKDVPVATVLNNAKRFPMMADRQLVLVREAQEIPDLNKEQGIKLMLSYINNPVPSTVLVLCHKHKSLDKRRELGKKAAALGFMFSFDKPKQYQLPDFVSAHFSDRGYKVESSGIQALCEYVGTDLNRMVNEMDKLLIGKTKDELITAEYIMARVGISREYNIFEFQKAVLMRDVPKVFQIVQYHQANTKRNPVIVTVAFFYSFFSKLLMAAYAKDKSPNGLISELKINPYAAKDYAQSLSSFSPDQIQKAITLLKTADLKLKGMNTGSAEDDGQILQELMIGIMH
jgi:DNA polymerase III subunit delta